MSIDYDKNNKERIPFEHYKELFGKLDPVETSKRCNIPYNEEKQEFMFRLMHKDHIIKFPSGEIFDMQGNKVEAFNINILVMRFFVEGAYQKPTGKLLTYRDIPWGDVYYPNFQGRCIMRLAFGFGFKLDQFKAAMESIGAEAYEMGDVAFRFEFMNNLYVYFILWGGDDEFQPSSQILFDDNLPAAFTAEDIAVVGDISIGILKEIASNL